jgi:hypothetical protein
VLTFTKKIIMKKVCAVIIQLSLFLAVGLNAQNTQKKMCNEYGIMMMTPDSLLSKEMLKTKYQIIYYFFSYTYVVDGKLVYKPDNNDDHYKKLPKQYIEHFIKNIDELNNWSDTVGRNEFMNSFPEMKRNVLAKLATMKE